MRRKPTIKYVFFLYLFRCVWLCFACTLITIISNRAIKRMRPFLFAAIVTHGARCILWVNLMFVKWPSKEMKLFKAWICLKPHIYKRFMYIMILGMSKSPYLYRYLYTFTRHLKNAQYTCTIKRKKYCI